MKNPKSFMTILFTALIVAGVQCSALAQTGAKDNRDANFADVNSAGSSVRWYVKTSYANATLTVAAPDGRVFRSEFKGGATPDFPITDQQGNRLADGQYTYELRLTQAFSAAAQKELAKTRGKDDEPEETRATRKRPEFPSQVQSGTFAILNGSAIVAGASEPGARPIISKNPEQAPIGRSAAGNAIAKSLQHHPLLVAMPDQVIPDDLIVQGSACIGLDCVNNESFGFDTIRLKENNTRIKFDDTSTTAGFPATDWQLTANDSASGGANKFSIEDITSGRVPFTVAGGAPNNSLFVNSSGRLGLRTATPVLDVHAVTGNTPGIRLEQDGSSGFTPQTWDVSGNESNFFVRDVTGGSRLPFRIRPGAPTSSIDISASGDVGIGTATPLSKLHVFSTATNDAFGGFGPDPVSGPALNFGYAGTSFGRGAGFFNVRPDASATAPNPSLRFMTVNVERMIITNAGMIGIGTSAPTDTLSVNGTASKPGGGSWAVFSDERLKSIKGQFNSGLKAVMKLQPLRYEYLPNNALHLNSQGEHIGFGAQAVQKIIPEAVTKTSEGFLQINNDPILWTMLNAIKEQQKEIEQLKNQVKQLQTSRHRRR